MAVAKVLLSAHAWMCIFGTDGDWWYDDNGDGDQDDGDHIVYYILSLLLGIEHNRS